MIGCRRRHWFRLSALVLMVRKLRDLSSLPAVHDIKLAHHASVDRVVAQDRDKDRPFTGRAKRSARTAPVRRGAASDGRLELEN